MRAQTEELHSWYMTWVLKTVQHERTADSLAIHAYASYTNAGRIAVERPAVPHLRQPVTAALMHLIYPRSMDEMRRTVDNFVARLESAAELDMEDHNNRKPAIHKLKMLPDVEEVCHPAASRTGNEPVGRHLK